MKITKYIFIILCLLSLLGCSQKKISAPEKPTEMTTVSYKVKSQKRNLNAAVITFTSEISGCASGYTQTGLIESNTSVAVPNGDSGCLYKLNQVVINGEIFDTSTQNFSQGSSFLITGDSSTQNLFVVNTQIILGKL